MSLLCKLFGHKPPCYKTNAGGNYMRISLRGIDGIGRQHAALYGECPRCGKQYFVGNTHVDSSFSDFDTISLNNTSALLEECLINGKNGQEVLYSWFLSNQKLIEQTMKELNELNTKEQTQ